MQIEGIVKVDTNVNDNDDMQADTYNINNKNINKETSTGKKTVSFSGASNYDITSSQGQT